MAEKQTNKERLKDITDSIETGIKELFESDKYRQYLATMSRFHRYSVNNTMLIYMQRPDATHVAGFNKWRDQFGRNVKKGEKGIKIIAPTPFKKKIEQQKLDPDTKLPPAGRERRYYHGGKDGANSHVQARGGVRRAADRRQAPAGAGGEPYGECAELRGVYGGSAPQRARPHLL